MTGRLGLHMRRNGENEVTAFEQEIRHTNKQVTRQKCHRPSRLNPKKSGKKMDDISDYNFHYNRLFKNIEAEICDILTIMYPRLRFFSEYTQPCGGNKISLSEKIRHTLLYNLRLVLLLLQPQISGKLRIL